MSREESSYSIPTPKFKGTEKEWNFFSKKFIALASQKGCHRVLNLDATAAIPLDNAVLDETDAGQLEQIKLRQVNAKAAGLLLNCMDTDTDGGQFAFDLVAQEIKPEDHHGGGHFPKAWARLPRWIRPTGCG